MWTSSAPLALRFAGIAWPLGGERVTVTLAPTDDVDARVVAAWGWTLRVAPDLPPPVEDEGPLGPAAEALRASPPRGGARLDVAGPGPGAPGQAAALRRAALAALALARGDAPPPPVGALERAVVTGAPAFDHGPAPASSARLAWLSARLVRFDDPFVAPAPPHATGDVDPRLVLEAEPAALTAALTGHGVPERPVWREERLDRALREAGLLARFRVAPGVGLALVEPGRRRELEAALTAHGLAPAACALGGPGVEAGAGGA